MADELTREDAAIALEQEIAEQEAKLAAMKAEHRLATRPEYPKTLYSKSKIQGVTVNSLDEEAALGSGYEDSPAKFGIETCPGAK